MNLDITRKKHKHFDLTPLIDVFFNVLLFFILTYQVSKYSEIKIDVPKSEVKNTLSKGIEIAITAKYEVYVNGVRTDINSLAVFLKNFDKTNNVVLKADRKVEVDFLIKVIDVISLVGFEKFSILTSNEKL